MEATVAQRKRQQQVRKLHSFIEEYEHKLDQRVDQVVDEILTHSKRVSELVNFPEIKRRVISHKDTRNASLNLTFDTYENHEALNTLTETYKKSMSKIGKEIMPAGRAVGNHRVVKPKLTRRVPQILPRQLRLNPFCERNAIKMFELEKGMLSLVERGRVGKDVNIITAFEKGKPILQTSKAIFHHGEEKFIDLVVDKPKLPQIISENAFNRHQENWAITMPKQEAESRHVPRADFAKQEIDFTSSIYVKFVHYEAVPDDSMALLKNTQWECFPELRQLLFQISKLLNQYCVEIAYADSKKMVQLVNYVRKPSRSQLEACLVSAPGCTRSLLTLQNMSSFSAKEAKARHIVAGCLKGNRERVSFLAFLKKRQIEEYVCGRAFIGASIKKRKAWVAAAKTEIEEKFSILQNRFKKEYCSMRDAKHFQIHIANEALKSGQARGDALNAQLPRVFNLQNIHTHVIYLLPCGIDPEAINYYYKIMELQDIPNFKERVTFVEVDPKNKFPPTMNVSRKLYYSSQSIRKLRSKIKNTAAYFHTSYLSDVDIRLAVYFSIPIFTGDLTKLRNVHRISEVQSIFSLPHMNSLVIPPSKWSIMDISDQLRAFCLSHKKNPKFVLKLNNRHQSNGLAILTPPFDSLPELYQQTLLVQEYQTTVDQFYHEIARSGGLIQQYEEEITPISVVGDMSCDGILQVIGTFQKISIGLVNIGYLFPQKQVEHRKLMESVEVVAQTLREYSHFGPVEILFYVDGDRHIMLEKVQCYLTSIGSSLYYFRFLVEGNLNTLGDYMARIMEEEGDAADAITRMQPRCYCYIPYLLHFGFSERQVGSFFQLCRMGGVSFDLQNKQGCTFILLGSLKNSLGLITSARERKTNLRLMIRSLQFIFKQNSQHSGALKEKETRMKERENILSIKDKLEEL